MGPGTHCFPYHWVPTANLWVQNTVFNDKSAILLHPGTRWNRNFASQRQNYVQKMQDAQVKKITVKVCLPKIFRPVTLNTLIFLFGLRFSVFCNLIRICFWVIKMTISFRRCFWVIPIALILVKIRKIIYNYLYVLVIDKARNFL